jgi:hypothetical protein
MRQDGECFLRRNSPRGCNAGLVQGPGLLVSRKLKDGGEKSFNLLASVSRIRLD